MSNDAFLLCMSVLITVLVAVELHAIRQRREHMEKLDECIESNEKHSWALEQHAQGRDRYAQAAEIYKTSVEQLTELRKSLE